MLSGAWHMLAQKEGFNEDLLRWTMKATAKVQSQILEDHMVRNDFMKSIMCRSTDFLRHVAGEVEERGAITSTYVSEHCRTFPVADFMWWITANHGG